MEVAPLAPILRLPPEVAERIAAGEVIERPASVVRELIDNAIDAGATEIRVEVRGGGLELIRVSDDGHGIPADQVELAFERHATSKLRVVDDLFRLHTLGFRGEALPSLAAVAEVTMLTRTDDASSGTLLALRAGEVVRRGRAARQRGTTVTVRHLFHPVPARLKFLSAGRAESLLAGQLVRRYALAHPRLRLSLLLDGHLAFQSSGSGTLDGVLAEIYGPAVAAALLRLDAPCSEGASLSGVISGRAVSRANRQHQTLIVNGRPVANRALAAALERAYRPFLPRGRHPIAVVVLHVPPSELDPNVHPAKSEIKLLRETEIAEALARAVREALGSTPVRPAPSDDFSLWPVQYHLPASRSRLGEAGGPGWEAADTEAPPLRAALPLMRIVSQVRRSLILAEGMQGFYLIDQHRAHERILYERLLRGTAGGQPPGQSLLEPLVLELKPHQAASLEERLPFLEGLGLSCERFGGRSFLVRAVPWLPTSENVAPYLQELLEEAALPDDAWRERLLASLACRAAVRRNRPLLPAEMAELLRDLAGTDIPAACPHGSPLILHFSEQFLARQFEW